MAGIMRNSGASASCKELKSALKIKGPKMIHMHVKRRVEVKTLDLNAMP